MSNHHIKASATALVGIFFPKNAFSRRTHLGERGIESREFERGGKEKKDQKEINMSATRLGDDGSLNGATLCSRRDDSASRPRREVDTAGRERNAQPESSGRQRCNGMTRSKGGYLLSDQG